MNKNINNWVIACQTWQTTKIHHHFIPAVLTIALPNVTNNLDTTPFHTCCFADCTSKRDKEPRYNAILSLLFCRLHFQTWQRTKIQCHFILAVLTIAFPNVTNNQDTTPFYPCCFDDCISKRDKQPRYNAISSLLFCRLHFQTWQRT